MDFAILRPSPERLAFVPEQNSEQAPNRRQGHVRHDRRNVARFNDPWCDELTKTVASDVLVNSDRNKHRSCNRVIRINRLCRGDSGQGRDLNASACVANNDNDLGRSISSAPDQ